MLVRRASITAPNVVRKFSARRYDELRPDADKTVVRARAQFDPVNRCNRQAAR